jgi:two-component system sensor kinase FixL
LAVAAGEIAQHGARWFVERAEMFSRPIIGRRACRATADRARNRIEPPSAAAVAANAGIERASEFTPLIVREQGGKICLWTRGSERLYGYSSAEAIGRNVDELLKTVFARPLHNIEYDLMQRGIWSGELTRRRKNGDVVVVESHWFLWRHGDGQAYTVREVDTDITQEKPEGGAQLYLASILESADDAIIAKTLDGIVTSWNKAAEFMFGYTAGEMLGQSIEKIIPPDRMNEEEAIIARLRCGEPVRHFETVRRPKSGANRDVSVTVSPIKSNSGQVISVSTIVRALGDGKRGGSRPKELPLELLNVSRLSHMAAALAHELDQPLFAIANYLRGSQRLLEKQPGKPLVRLQEALAGAAMQILRASEIVRRLRDFPSRGGTDKRVENLVQLVEETSELVALSAKERRMRVHFTFDHGARLVVADKIQIQQVLLNLMRSAAKAMDACHRQELAISATTIDDHMILISVTNAERGLPVGVKSLSTLQTIIRAHGGRIWIESNRRGGAIFRFTLPAAMQETCAMGSEPATGICLH